MIMRTFFGVFVLLFSINTVKASYQSDINLIDQIKLNHTARSKPTYPKFAAVSFLKSADTSVDFKGTLDVKSQCGALGYVVKVDTCTSKTGKLNGISVNPYKPSKLCSDDDSIKAADKEEAKKYTTGCCDSRIYTVDEDAACPHNAAKLSNDVCYWGGKNKYRCACDRGRYQYSTIQGEQCGSSFDSFNVNLACSAYEPRTEKSEVYFISCCPSSYSVCKDKNHEVGRGNECRVIDSKEHLALVIATPALKDQYVYSKYEDCVCAPHYDKECPSSQVIDGNLKCIDKNEKIWTPESNCESNCSKTIETNIDSYLYKKIWHCLYRKDGAVIRDDEDENSVCGIFDKNKNVGSYDECLAQGYNKREADCYNSSTILRCPNDSTKVWCLEGKYCTGYDVGSYLGVEYCTEGANIEMCPSMDKEKRCQYKNEKCNCMWNDGEFDVTLHNCLKYFSSIPEAQTFATSPTIDGNDETCCKRGYKMQLGRCVKNICDRNLYPYDLRPGDEMGELEVCYEGDTSAELGYKAYFGYTSCHDDPSQGQKWIRKSNDEYVCPNGEEVCAENAKIHNADYYQCICARKGELGGILLPFGSDLFFDNNENTSDNYIHIGFYQGNYGEQVDCTDAEGSYYGYKACYIGSTMHVIGSVSQGKCKLNTSRTQTPYYTDAQSMMYGKRVFSDVGLPINMTFSKPITNKLGDPSKVFCINPTQHCPNGDPEQCDESVKPLLIDGCINGWEEECSYKCYHINNLVQEEGTYKLNTKGVKMVIGSIKNADDRRFGFESCPIGFIRSGSYNACFKVCSIDDIKKCEIMDLLTLYHENELYNADGSSKFTLATIDKKKIVGIVFGRDDRSNSKCGTSGKMHVFSLKSRNYNYSDATLYPTSNTFKNDVGEAIFNLGTWGLPTISESNGDCLYMYGGKNVVDAILNGFSAGSGDFWTANEGVYRNCCVLENSPLTTSRRARPVIRLNLN